MKVHVSKKCHCVIKNEFDNDIECNSKEEALIKAHDILNVLDKETCKTHLFFIKEENDRIVIDSKSNPHKGY